MAKVEKVRLSEVGQEAGKSAKDAYEAAKKLEIDVKTASSSVSLKDAELILNFLTTGVNPNPPKESKPPKATKDAKKSPKQKVHKDEEKKPKTSSTKKADEPKQEQKIIESAPQEQDELKDTTQRPITPLTRGEVRVVRKNQPQVTTSTPTPKPKPSAYLSAQELLRQTEDSQNLTKDKKKIKTKNTQKQARDGEHTMDIKRDIDFERDEDEEQNEIVLLDLNQQELRDEDEENRIRQAITDRVQVHRKSPWMNEGSIRRGSKKPKKHAQKEEKKEFQSVIAIPQEVRVYEFAERSGREIKDVIKVLFDLGRMATKNDFLDKDCIEILAEEFNIEINIVDEMADFADIYEQNTTDSNLQERPPVVSIMGHVDHGKTSLLDYIRNSRIATKEAGGITQHIGAYMVEKNGKHISFIDTPGHEAFSSMRARGAQVTDIAIIVIAADDGVKPQTIEALNHAKSAGVQIIIAMNKMDKSNVNPDKLKAECAELGFTPNDWGGEYEFIPISAKSGEGIDSLLETILIQAEVLELKASFDGRAKAIVLEGSLEKGRGPVASVIVKSGVLKTGDCVVAGTAFGRIRAMSDDMGRAINALTPSTVAQIVGLSEVPSAGSELVAVESEVKARQYAQKLALHLRQKELSKSTKVTFEELGDMVAKGSLKALPIIIKADTQGSLEAIKASLEKLSNDEVYINIISAGVGGISESDVSLASASENSFILGFNVRPTGSVKAKAKELSVEVKTYSIIYALLEDIQGLISGMMNPTITEENTGQAEVKETFNIPKIGTVAGCMVVDGKIERGIKVRLIRDGVVMHTGQIASLKRFKDDAKEVAKGYECGIMLEGYNDVIVGDVFETFREVTQKPRI